MNPNSLSAAGSRELWRWLNPLAAVAMLIVNYLFSTNPPSGQTTQAISAKYPVMITPAGYVFPVIWGLIYALVIAFCIYQALPGTLNNRRIRRTDGLFLLSCLLNIAWLFLWSNDRIFASTLVIVLLLITLVLLYTRTRSVNAKPGLGDRLFVLLPFSLYTAWITMATLVNVAVFLYQSEWNGFGLSDTFWAVAILTAGAALATAVSRAYRDPAFAAVFVWAFAGVAVKQHEHPAVFAASLILAAFMLAIALSLIPFFHRTWSMPGKERAR
ncbi:tryptophan-rich sensory protein [Gorillibacterium sp. sgz500922]|uniref:tryptophan-rich sensory protein n=1 Tax=Gorillibacterium sp. sgz500922 TaxID=3446694 RepID=UPI003F668EB0